MHMRVTRPYDAPPVVDGCEDEESNLEDPCDDDRQPRGDVGSASAENEVESPGE